MNWQQIEGKWDRMRGKVKEKWGQLTDNELDVIAGKRDQLVGALKETYGMQKEMAEREIDAWRRLSRVEARNDYARETNAGGFRLDRWHRAIWSDATHAGASGRRAA